MIYYPGDLVRHNGLEYFRITVPATAADDSLPVGFEMSVIPPKVPSRGYDTPCREQKIAAHATVGGKGKIARLRRKKKTW